MDDSRRLEPGDDIIAEFDRRQQTLTIRLLNIYHSYRVVVGFALLLTTLQPWLSTKLGSLNTPAFVTLCTIYVIANIGVVLTSRWWQQYSTSTAMIGIVVADIVSLTGLMYLSDGISSGLAALILVSVAVGAILLSRRIAAFLAAIASISVIYEEFYLGISTSGQVDVFQAGIFGGLYFITAIALQALANRMQENELITLTQKAELDDLEQLNRQIIQRMRTGIIVVDADNSVRMHNHSARTLVGLPGGQTLTELPPQLADRINKWRQDITVRAAPFKVAEHSSQIRINFAPVRPEQADGEVTIFIEDTSEVQQQAQQLKLAELGRLSASIAHEVRNPLGAISHAAQLLNESGDLTDADQRLTDIITSHCQRMNGVVENVLEMSRRRSPEPHRLNLKDLLQEFISDAALGFNDAEIEIAIDPANTVVRIDPSHFNQTLTNLIDNGLRYSEENGAGRKVLLEGGIDSTSDRPFLHVIDFGVGVDPEQVGDLFQPFSTTAIGGTGLGLYISKELCDANQAQLSYLKSPKAGSCFRILFAHPDRIAL